MIQKGYIKVKGIPGKRYFYYLTPTGFDAYLEWRVTQDRNLQKEFVTDERGIQIIDFDGRYEQLAEDFQHVATHYTYMPPLLILKCQTMATTDCTTTGEQSNSLESTSTKILSSLSTHLTY